MLFKIKEKNKNILFILSILLIFEGLIIICFKLVDNTKKNNEDNKLLKNYIVDNIDNQEDINKNTTNKKIKIQEQYIAILDIPSIKLKRGFFNSNSKLNNVNKNIYLYKKSQMPDIEKGNLVLAAHSGNTRVAFFNKLSQLKINDIANIIYNNKTYKYILRNKYEVEKTGKVKIIRDANKKTLTLITCKKKTNKQIVLIFEEE